MSSLESGTPQLTAKRVAGMGSFRCLSIMKKLRILILQCHGKELRQMDTGDGVFNIVCKVVNFICPLGHEGGAEYPFNQLDSNKSIRRAMCQIPYSSNKWCCPFNKPWSACPEYFRSFIALPSTKRKHGAPSVDTEEQHSSKIRRIETKELVQSQLHTIGLGEKLSRRFPHLAKGSSRPVGDDIG